MNFEYAEKINGYLEKLEFEKAIQIAESELVKIPETAFHEVLGKSFTDQVEDLVRWIDIFVERITGDLEIKSLYFEMNEFDINTDIWFIDGFAYSKDDSLEDLDWLSDYEADTQKVLQSIFALKGLEQLQDAFENSETDTEELENAKDWSEQIVIARFMQLMRAAHLLAKEKQLSWSTLPLYFTEHEYDFIVKSTV